MQGTQLDSTIELQVARNSNLGADITETSAAVQEDTSVVEPAAADFQAVLTQLQLSQLRQRPAGLSLIHI